MDGRFAAGGQVATEGAAPLAGGRRAVRGGLLDDLGQVPVRQRQLQVVVDEADHGRDVLDQRPQRLGEPVPAAPQGGEHVQGGGDLQFGGLPAQGGRGDLGVPQPPVGLLVLAQGAVVEVEAVRRDGVRGTGGVLPPEAGAVLAAREVEDGAEDAGPGRLGELAAEEGTEPLQGAGPAQQRLAQGPQVPGGWVALAREPQRGGARPGAARGVPGPAGRDPGGHAGLGGLDVRAGVGRGGHQPGAGQLGIQVARGVEGHDRSSSALVV